MILAYWKSRGKDNFEVFSNLKHFTASYPKYSYNTLNNYLSKAKKPFENDDLRIERKFVHNKPIKPAGSFRVVPVVQRGSCTALMKQKKTLNIG